MGLVQHRVFDGWWLFGMLLLLRLPLVEAFVVSDALRLVVRRQGQDQSHDGLEVALQDLLGGDLVHPDPLGGHELEDPLQVLPHAVDRLGVVLDAGDLLAGDDLDQLGQHLRSYKYNSKLAPI